MGIFIDLEDAFNSINLYRLQSIMNRMGIPPQYSNWIINCYQNREITIETIDGNRINKSNEGVPQLDVLSPLIFLIYTSSTFSMNSGDSKLFQFADDLCVIAWSKECNL